MPNLHWYGTEDDHAAVLSDIFALDVFEVFELYSEPGKPIRKFARVDEALELFQAPLLDGTARSTIHLNLWVKGSAPEPGIVRFALNPKKSGGHSWGERSSADGFVKFYLERFVAERLMHSQTNTPSEARMGAVEGIVRGPKGTTLDVRLANRMSSKLNRMIKKRAVAKIAASPILPGADALWRDGVSFDHHWSIAKTPDLYSVV